MKEKKKPKSLDEFEREQQEALRFCQMLYGTNTEILKRPTKCCVPGCKNPYVYNSGMCTDHAF